MRLFLFTLLTLQLLTSRSSAAPLSSSHSSNPSSALLLPRRDHCYNAPDQPAGKPLPPRTASFPPEPSSITWCDLHSSTYLIITNASPLLQSAVEQILDDASLFVTQMLQRDGDGLIPHGFWTLEEYGLELAFTNAGNHQQTWGVVGAALMALLDYFQYRVLVGSVRAVRFQVWDGRHLVGTGWLRG